MKANAPEKIYIHVRANKELGTTWHGTRIGVHDIEYVRKDAFIEKAANHLNYILYDRIEINNPGTIIPSLCTKGEFIEDFKKYVEK